MKNSLAAVVSYGGSAASEITIIDDQGAASGWDVAGLAKSCDDTLGCASEFAVLNNNRADGLVGGGIGHVDTDLAIVDVHRLEIPKPVPVHEDSSIAAVEGQIASGELLIANEHAVVATVEDEIGHPSSRAIVHEDALLLIARATFDHVEDDVLEARSLGDLPVDSSASGRRHSSQINDEVPNLTEEVVLIGVPIGTSILIWIRVNDGDSLEACCALDGWWRAGVTDKLGVIELDDWFADEVVAGWEVYQSWRHSA